MKKILSVSAIDEGTVIDHIPAGQGMRIATLLHLASQYHQVTLGLNLPSQRMGYKDLIKIRGREITESEAKHIALFAPKATINMIHEFQLSKKFKVMLPEKVENLLRCPNAQCVSNHESITVTRFYVDQTQLTCYYCEKSFAHDTF